MAHDFQRQFVQYVKDKHPRYFSNTNVLDCGSLDINGTNRWAFDGGTYTGVDIIAGPNVDTVCCVHKLPASYNERFDMVISTEMLEHDCYWWKSILKMYKMVRPGGLLLITAAGTGRAEHGTRAHNPWASPATVDFYENMDIARFREAFSWDMEAVFAHFELFDRQGDFQFWGIKRHLP